MVSCRCRWTKGKLGKQRYDMQESKLHLLTILFTRNRSESLIVVLKLTFGTRVFQRQQSRCKIISIILMKYFFVWTFPADEYDAPSQSRSEIQSGDYVPLHRRWRRVKSQRLLPPTSILVSSCSGARACKTLHWWAEHWQYAKYSTQAVAVYNVTESR